MKDKTVEILLNNPLHVLADREEIKSRPGLDNMVRLTGKIIEQFPAGVLIEVKSVGAQKMTDRNLPFSQVFIPFHKIDHMILISS